jgi:glycosyltransferase involved in cell wall biosynthesis
MSITADTAGQRILPRALAGATVLQMVPALRNSFQARNTIRVARALIHAGARAIVAGEPGILVDELQSFGGEWLPFSSVTFNPTKLRANANRLDNFIAAERVDIVHARNAGAAWSALVATDRNSIHLVTDLPELPRKRMWLAAFYLGSLSQGDRVIAHSMFNARPMIARHRIPVERVRVISPAVDLQYFDAANVPAERAAKLRQVWGIPHGMRVALVPGRVAPWNGHLVLAEAARILADRGMEGVTFVLVGDDRLHRRFARKFWKEARAAGVDALFRMAGHHADMSAAYAAADIVIVPYTSPPVYGRVVAEAQAMGRPVIASSVGTLPEKMVTPPGMPEVLRTGWAVEPGDPGALANAIETAFALDADEFRACAARAREFAEYTFSPQRAAAAMLEIYASLLEHEDMDRHSGQA